jgi:hypothetical protein
VAKLVEALRYKPESCGFYSLGFFVDLILSAALWPLTGTGTRDISWGEKAAGA